VVKAAVVKRITDQFPVVLAQEIAYLLTKI